VVESHGKVIKHRQYEIRNENQLECAYSCEISHFNPAHFRVENVLIHSSEWVSCQMIIYLGNNREYRHKAMICLFFYRIFYWFLFSTRSFNIIQVILSVFVSNKIILPNFFWTSNFLYFDFHSTFIIIQFSRVNEVESRKIDSFIAITNNTGNSTTEMRTVHSCENEVISMTISDWCSNYVFISFIVLPCLLLFMGYNRLSFHFKLFRRIAINFHDKYFCHLTRATIQQFQNESSKRSLVKNFTIDIPMIDSKLNRTSLKCFIVR
jgi:hypothetical protein